MLTITHDIIIGTRRLASFYSVEVNKSIHTISDTAKITLPAMVKGKVLNVESQVFVGDVVDIYLGYNGKDIREFQGYISDIEQKKERVILHCQDSTFLLTRKIADGSLTGEITIKSILERINPPTFRPPYTCLLYTSPSPRDS